MILQHEVRKARTDSTRHRTRRRALGIFLGAGLLSLAACGGSDSTSDSTSVEPAVVTTEPAAKPVLVVGAVLPLTGTFSDVGTAAEAGLRATAQIINEDGGILGHQLEVVVRDDGGETQQAVAAMREILQIPNLIAVVPEVFSHLTPALAPLANEAGILGFTVADMKTVAPDPTLFPLLYGTNRPNSEAVRAQLALARKLGVKTIGVLTPENAVALQTFQNAQDLAANYGITVVGAEKFALSSTDVTPQLSILKGKKPDALVIWGTSQPLGVIARGIRDLGMKNVRVFGADEALHKDMAVTIPESIQGQFHFVMPRAGSIGSRSATGDRFLAVLNANGPITGNMSSAMILHDGLQTVRYGFERAGSLEGKLAAVAIDGMINDASPPAWWVQYPTGPRFSADAHGTSNVDLSTGFWATLVAPFVNANGIFEAEPFDYVRS